MKLPEKQYLKDDTMRCINDIDALTIELKAVNYSKNLFEGYKRIIVVGPQRSGTTFTSIALANTLNFRNVDEIEFGVDKVDRFRDIIKQENIVVQAPAMTCRIQSLVGKDDLVVFMKRKWSDILKGLYKKNGKLSNFIFMWVMFDYDKYRFSEYDKEASKAFDKYVNIESSYLNSYYNMWKHYQSKLIPNCITLEYESMKTHPMWLNKDQRKDFTDKQTEIIIPKTK